MQPDTRDFIPSPTKKNRFNVGGDEQAIRWGRPLTAPAAIREFGALGLVRLSEGGHYYDHPAEDVRRAMVDSADRRAAGSLRNFPGWDSISDFVLDVCTAAAPQTAYTATRLVTTVGGFVSWAHTVKHYPLNAELLFRREVIELYIKHRQVTGNLEDGGLRNYRSQLFRVSEFVLPSEHPYKPAPLNRRTSVPPYNEDDALTLRRWIINQPNATKKRRAVAMVCLAMGAGLTSREIVMISTDQVTIDDRGIVVRVPEGRIRDVPLLAEWEPPLRRLLEQLEPGEPLFGIPSEQNKKNIMSSFAAKSSSADFRPRADRMRAAWIVWHLTHRTQMRALMTAAGILKMENLLRYLEFVPELNTEEYRAELRGQVTR
jgi:integrase